MPVDTMPEAATCGCKSKTGQSFHEIHAWTNLGSEVCDQESEVHVEAVALGSVVPTERSEVRTGTHGQGSCTYTQALPECGQAEPSRHSGARPARSASGQGSLFSRGRGAGAETLAAGTNSSMGRSQQGEHRLHWQLNQFSKEDVFMGRFEVFGPRQRRRGGAVRCREHPRSFVATFSDAL